MAFLNPLLNTFGLDIGDRSFKLVQLVKLRRGAKQYRLVAWHEIAVPEGVLVRGEIADIEAAAEHIRKLVGSAKGKLSGKAVVASLPEPRTFIKIINVTGGTDEASLKKAVLAEIEQNIPLPTDDIYFDWQVVDEPAPAEAAPKAETEAAKAPPSRVLVGAAPKSLVDSYTAMLEQAGLAPIAFEIEAMALPRALVYC